MAHKPMEQMVEEAIAANRAQADVDLCAAILVAINDAKAQGKHDTLREDERIAREVLNLFNIDAPTEHLLAARRRLRAGYQQRVLRQALDAEGLELPCGCHVTGNRIARQHT